MSLPAPRFRTVTWREGTAGERRSRFAARRVRPAPRDYLREETRCEEGLLIEWPKGATEPTQYWLLTLAPDTSVKQLAWTVKLRWRIERDYQELKDELGLAHFEGRGCGVPQFSTGELGVPWRGFHHHAPLSRAAYAFPVRERGLFSPSGVGSPLELPLPRVPRGFRPRGASDSAGTA